MLQNLITMTSISKEPDSEPETQVLSEYIDRDASFFGFAATLIINGIYLNALVVPITNHCYMSSVAEDKIGVSSYANRIKGFSEFWGYLTSNRTAKCTIAWGNGPSYVDFRIVENLKPDVDVIIGGGCSLCFFSEGIFRNPANPELLTLRGQDYEGVPYSVVGTELPTHLRDFNFFTENVCLPFTKPYFARAEDPFIRPGSDYTK